MLRAKWCIGTGVCLLRCWPAQYGPVVVNYTRPTQPVLDMDARSNYNGPSSRHTGKICCGLRVRICTRGDVPECAEGVCMCYI